MKVATKLSVAFGVLLVVLASLLVYHVRTNRSAISANFDLSDISARLNVTATQQIAALNQLEESAGKFWVTRDEGYLQLFQTAYREFETGLTELNTHSQTSQE